jgi:hypothetical protein
MNHLAITRRCFLAEASMLLEDNDRHAACGARARYRDADDTGADDSTIEIDATHTPSLLQDFRRRDESVIVT